MSLLFALIPSQCLLVSFQSSDNRQPHNGNNHIQNYSHLHHCHCNEFACDWVEWFSQYRSVDGIHESDRSAFAHGHLLLFVGEDDIGLINFQWWHFLQFQVVSLASKPTATGCYTNQSGSARVSSERLRIVWLFVSSVWFGKLYYVKSRHFHILLFWCNLTKNCRSFELLDRISLFFDHSSNALKALREASAGIRSYRKILVTVTRCRK